MAETLGPDRRPRRPETLRQNAHTIVEQLNELNEQVMTTLSAGLEAYPPTQPNPGNYDEKNYYTLNSETAAVELFGGNHAGAAINLLERMSQWIMESDGTVTPSHNKGVVFGNLGVAYTAVGNVDAGGAYFIQAQIEDMPWGGGPILHSRIYTQFEDMLIGWIDNAVGNMRPWIQTIDVKQAIQGMWNEESLRSIFFAVGYGLFRNFDHYQRGIANDFARSRLLLGLRDLCLITEELLRMRARDRGLTASSGTTLGPLLSTPSLLTEPIRMNIASQTSNGTVSVRSTGILQFSANMERIFSLPHDSADLVLSKGFLATLAIRNFANHNLQTEDCLFFQQVSDALGLALICPLAILQDIC